MEKKGVKNEMMVCKKDGVSLGREYKAPSSCGFLQITYGHFCMDWIQQVCVQL